MVFSKNERKGHSRQTKSQNNSNDSEIATKLLEVQESTKKISLFWKRVWRALNSAATFKVGTPFSEKDLFKDRYNYRRVSEKDRILNFLWARGRRIFQFSFLKSDEFCKESKSSVFGSVRKELKAFDGRVRVSSLLYQFSSCSFTLEWCTGNVAELFLNTEIQIRLKSKVGNGMRIIRIGMWLQQEKEFSLLEKGVTPSLVSFPDEK